jgi:hypothetical protein
MSWRRLVVLAALLLIAAAYYEAAFDNAFSASNRFRIILAMLFLQAIAVVVLAALLAQLLGELRSHHRAASQVAILRGLWKALRIGATEGGGLPVAVRQQIHEAGEEAFDTYDRIMRRNLGTARTGLALRFHGQEHPESAVRVSPET